VGFTEATSLYMDFRIADTFTDSLARLTGDEQKWAAAGFKDTLLRWCCKTWYRNAQQPET